MGRKLIIISSALSLTLLANAQEKLALDDIFSRISTNSASLKSFDAQIRALDEAWDPLESTCRHASLSIL